MKKTERVKYIDISLMILNFIAMVVITILVLENIVLAILSFFSTAVLFGLTLVSFSRKNPFYIFPSSGMAICGLVFSIGIVMMPELPFYSFFSIFFLVTIVLDFCLIASLMKVSEDPWSGMSSWINIGSVIEPDPSVPMYIKDRYKQVGNGKSNKAIELDQKRLIRKKYNAWWILLITLIFTFIFFSTTILSLL